MKRIILIGVVLWFASGIVAQIYFGSLASLLKRLETNPGKTLGSFCFGPLSILGA